MPKTVGYTISMLKILSIPGMAIHGLEIFMKTNTNRKSLQKIMRTLSLSTPKFLLKIVTHPLAIRFRF
jgi:hypothetical protein